MGDRQFHVLYRQFLFQMVDREVLSAHALGDANKLLGNFAATLIWISIPFGVMALSLDSGRKPWQAVLVSAWAPEHALIATTMLVTGVFAVLSWDSIFPSRRDVLVLAPLPIRAGTILAAKAASLASALGVAICIFNAAPGLALPLALIPPGSNLLDVLFSLLRALFVYWITMAMAGTFVLSFVMLLQGTAALLPRALSLRLSSVLQIAAFCLFVGMYFLQPSLSSPQALAEPLNRRLLAWLPSYWFLGVFQKFEGIAGGAADSTMAWLAVRGFAGWAIAVTAAAASFLISSIRTLHKTVEEPDIAPRSRGPIWLPRFGSRLETAVVQFSIRTLFRSRQHRVIVSFFSGIGFAIVILFVKTPFAQQMAAASGTGPLREVTLPLLASSFVMMCFWILGIRAAFAMPTALRANWIFRITPVAGGLTALAASRRAMYAIALAPFWTASAAAFLWLWPWRAAVGHLAALGIAGIAAVELCLYGFRKIPFTCSWLPGKTNVHMTVILCLMLGLNATYWAAYYERRALGDGGSYAVMLTVLLTIALVAWWRTRDRAKSEDAPLDFEEAPAPAILSLGLHRDGVFPID
jgi:hypothetical protein